MLFIDFLCQYYYSHNDTECCGHHSDVPITKSAENYQNTYQVKNNNFNELFPAVKTQNVGPHQGRFSVINIQFKG